jgi:hypothetical protein
MWHCFVLLLFFISSGGAAGYGIMAGSTYGASIGAEAGILAVAILLAIFTGSWVSNIHIFTYHILKLWIVNSLHFPKNRVIHTYMCNRTQDLWVEYQSLDLSTCCTLPQPITLPFAPINKLRGL